MEMQKSRLAPFGGIIFDLDGTLLDSIEDIAMASNKVLINNGLPGHSLDKYVEFIGNGARRIIQRALPEHLKLDDVVVEKILDEYKTAYKENIVVKSCLFEGISELLLHLNNRKIPIAINTNKPHDQTMLIAQKLLNDFIFAVLVGQRDENQKKPDPFGALYIANHLGLKPEEILFVGDSAVDVKTAQNAGMQMVGVSWGYSKENELENAGCETIVDSVSELRILIDNCIYTKK
ncbi:MAG: HAD-IA family hydrolase [Prolixibacteraceae bacterium]|nr:HAD-IA family hydrolase [Prolixibacteraceae bacterium]MBN2649355.1 HAD-IA family hydrolase [Prolixibacteraceae bacterium]